MNTVKFFLNGKEVTVRKSVPRFITARLSAFRRSRSDRSEKRLRTRRMRCLHGHPFAVGRKRRRKSNIVRSIPVCVRFVRSTDYPLRRSKAQVRSADRNTHFFITFPSAVVKRFRCIRLMPSPKEINPQLVQTRKKIDEVRDKILGEDEDAAFGKIYKVNEGMNPVAHRLAVNNGTQCGYCTVGWVMNMSAFLAEKPKPTKREIEDIFDGNICRCTGYRAILTGMKTFASDWSAEDEENRMQCKTEDVWEAQRILPAPYIPFPNEAKTQPQPVEVRGNEQTWLTPATLDELGAIINENRDKTVRMVHGNTSYGIYKEEFLEADLLVDIRLIPDLYGIEESSNEIQVGASVTYSRFSRPSAIRHRTSLEDQNAGRFGKSAVGQTDVGDNCVRRGAFYGAPHRRNDRPQRRQFRRQYDADAQTYSRGRTVSVRSSDRC